MNLLEALLDRPQRKAVSGPGAVMMAEGVPLTSLLDSDPRKKAQQAIEIWKKNLWIRACERTISTRLGTTGWHLEDTEGQNVTDESTEGEILVRDTIAKPYTPQPGDPRTATPTTQRGLWSITSRHVGVVGYAFWYLSNVQGEQDWPLELLYIHPARMLPSVNDAGALLGWVMDYGTQDPVTFTPEEILKFDLEPPDEGHLGIGLVESAISRIDMVRLSDRHANQTMAAGGRRPGIYKPPTGAPPLDNETFGAIQRDIRSISEMPDATKRSLVLKGPMDFQETSATPADLNLVEMADLGRDGILALWGVPRSQLGMDVPAGLNSGATKDKDEEVLWKNGIGPRLRAIRETTNVELLPRVEESVGRLILETEEPQFDDDLPQYDMAQKAISQPLRNVERRAILGLEPFGDPALDDAVWLPVGTIPAFDTPPHDPETLEQKARIVNPRLTRQFAKALDEFLVDQGNRIAAKITKNSAAIERKPNDTSPYWNQKAEDAALQRVMEPYMIEEAETGYRQGKRRLGRAGAGKAGPFPENFLSRASKAIARRVTLINNTTRDRIKKHINDGLDLGMSPAQVAVPMRADVPPLPGDKNAWKPVYEGAHHTFASELRAETIARTEMRVVQNQATSLAYEDAGIEKVRMIDGDEDPICAARDGQVVTLAEFDQHVAEEHPNGTLDAAPVAV